MKETIFEQVASAASVLKLDLSAEEFALFAEDREFSEAGMEAVQMLLGYLSEKTGVPADADIVKMPRQDSWKEQFTDALGSTLAGAVEKLTSRSAPSFRYQLY